MRLNAFDYFRGLAIISIVASHTSVYWTMESFYANVFANLIAGGTTFFVFISGFFFHHVFYQKFEYREFLVKKLQNVLLPYTLLTVIGIVCFVYYLHRPPYAEVFITQPIDSWLQNIILWLNYWWSGSILDAYWYVPFIMIMFLLSPLFIKQIEQPIKIQLAWFIGLLCVSVLIHRPSHNLSHLHSVLYFIPVYMLGIICSIKKEPVFRFLEGKSAAAGLAVLVVSVAQVLIYQKNGNFHKDSLFSYAGIDIMLLQKIVMCFFLLSVLQKFKDLEIPFLKFMATASFAIYFIHPWVLYFFDYFAVFKRLDFLPGIIGLSLTALAVLVISIAIAAMVKLTLGRRSRFVIGW